MIYFHNFDTTMKFDMFLLVISAIPCAECLLAPKQVDRPSFLKAVACRYESRGLVVTIQIDNSKNVIMANEKDAAAKVMKEAISALEHQLDGGPLEKLELEAARLRLRYTKRLLDYQIKSEVPRFTHVSMWIVKGRARQAHLQYSDVAPAWSDAFSLPAVRKAGMQELTFVLPAKNLKPGDYTVIITPMDQGNTSGAAIMGSSDTMSFTWEGKRQEAIHREKGTPGKGDNREKGTGQEKGT